MTQAFVYLQLSIGLNLCIIEQKDPALVDEAAEKAQYKELLTSILMTFGVFALPIAMLIEFLTIPRVETVYGEYLFYEIQCISVAIINTVIMTVATIRILGQMT